jgi:hypothetical protein
LKYMVVLGNYLIQGWIQHDLPGGRWVLFQLWCRVVSVMCAARPSTCFTTVFAW